LNDFSVGEAKISENNQDNQIQIITFMQYVFFEKGPYSVQ